MIRLLLVNEHLYLSDEWLVVDLGADTKKIFDRERLDDMLNFC